MTTTARLPKPPREVPADRSLERLAPQFRAKVALLLARMHARGFTAIVAEAFRSDDRQAYLFGFGRLYDDGRGIVTKARSAAFSYHGYGLAVDIVDATLGWDAPAAFWTALREEAEALGLTSGDDWDHDGIPVEQDPDEHLCDKPHVQFPRRKCPSLEAERLRAAGDYEGVWRLAGAL